MRTTIIALFALVSLAGATASAREVDDAAMVEAARQAPMPRMHDERVLHVKSDAVVPAKYDVTYPTRDLKRRRPLGSI